MRVELATSAFVGTGTDLTDDGVLVVETADGRREVAAEDIVHLRPANDT